MVISTGTLDLDAFAGTARGLPAKSSELLVGTGGGDSTTEDDEPDGAYFPSQQRKKKSKAGAVNKGRSRTVSLSSDTDGEEMTCWTNTAALQSNAAAVEERMKAAEEKANNEGSGAESSKAVAEFPTAKKRPFS